MERENSELCARLKELGEIASDHERESREFDALKQRNVSLQDDNDQMCKELNKFAKDKEKFLRHLVEIDQIMCFGIHGPQENSQLLQDEKSAFFSMSRGIDEEEHNLT
eukprot:4875420-Ditylum_brightwellii.AAC.1